MEAPEDLVELDYSNLPNPIKLGFSDITFGIMNIVRILNSTGRPFLHPIPI